MPPTPPPDDIPRSAFEDPERFAASVDLTCGIIDALIRERSTAGANMLLAAATKEARGGAMSILLGMFLGVIETQAAHMGVTPADFARVSREQMQGAVATARRSQN